MKIAFINGSPKKGGASAMLIEEMTEMLSDMQTMQYHAYNREFVVPETLREQDVLVFVFPLYVDGLPSQLVRSIREHADTQVTESDIFVSPNFPRRLYMLAAQIGWRRQIKKNGLKVKDLGRTLLHQ